MVLAQPEVRVKGTRAAAGFSSRKNPRWGEFGHFSSSSPSLLIAHEKNSQWITSFCFQEVPQEHLSSLRKGREEAKAERERQSEELLVSSGGVLEPPNLGEGSVLPGHFLAVGICSHLGRGSDSCSPWESQPPEILLLGGDYLSSVAAGLCPHGDLSCGIAEADGGGAAEDRG